MEKFLEIYNLPKLNQEAESQSSPITATETEAVIKKLSTNKSPVWVASQVNFIKHQDKLTPILLKLFQKVQEEGRFPRSFYEVSISLIPKPDEDTTKRKL